MNCATDFIITTKRQGDRHSLMVWMGRYGWSGVSEDHPGDIGRGHVYKKESAASKAIDRMRTKYPNDWRWLRAGYCTLDEARSDNNPLGIDWNVP